MLIGDQYTTGDGLSLGVSLVLLEIPDNDWIKQVLISAFNTLTIEENWNDDFGDIEDEQATRIFSLILQTIQFDYEPPPVTPVGQMTPWPGTTAPTGWILCQGQSLLRASYPDLFGVLGTNYGSVDSTHFNLPDMRNKSPFGLGTTLTPIGTNGGALNKTLSVNELAVHAHGVNDGGHSHVERTGSVQAHAATGGTGFTTFGTAVSSNAALQSTDPALSNLTINNTGLATPFSLLHPVIALNYVIFSGV